MARKCVVYKPGEYPCDTGVNETVMAADCRDCSIPSNVSDLAKKITNGVGINRKTDCESFCDSLVVEVKIKIRNSKYKDAYQKITVNSYLSDEIVAIFDEIYNEAPNFRVMQQINSYEFRKAKRADGSDGPNNSDHSYGIALDINQHYNPFLVKNGIRQEYQKGDASDDSNDICFMNNKHKVVKIFAQHGWGWGGNYNNEKDYMHFHKIIANG